MTGKAKVLLGITGSIAAYKAASLIRLLVKDGYEVKVVMTSNSKDFISPLTLATLSKHPVHSEFYDAATGEWANHVELALWADFILVAPATANEIAKFANGLCDNLLTAIYLSAKCPVIIAPAMDLDMYIHPSTKANFSKLISYGNIFIDSEVGELASGLIGQGRMAEPEHILSFLNDFSENKKRLSEKKILITAGPTQEAIDPVRYISNHSTGKMGYAIAEELAKEGAKVFLVSGPSQLKIENPSISIIKVKSALEMLEECKKLFASVDASIFTAAVADYRVKEISNQKIKKKEDSFVLEMVKNPDIAFEFGKVKTNKQLSVGFALETNNELENASSKLQSKNFNFIVLNSTQSENATFGYDTNQVTIITKEGERKEFGLKSKKEVAKDIINELINQLNQS